MRISDWSSDVCSSDLVCHFHPFGGVRCLSTSRKQWICSAFRSAPSGRSVVVAPMVLKSFLRADLRALAYAMRTAIQSRATDDPKQKSSYRLPFRRSEEHTSELQSLMRISYAVFCLKQKRHTLFTHNTILQLQLQ